MSTLKTWFSALRLRTLPLALSSIVLAITVADLSYSANTSVALLCTLTAVLLQILSNLANDYGDFVKGTDNNQRLGNMRALQSGNISVGQMRAAILLFVLLSFISGICLLFVATNGNLNAVFLLFLFLGITAIAAAIKYTVGKNAYGYSGLGDIAVFVFFGPVAVLGTFFLTTGLSFSIADDWRVFFAAIAVGLLSTAVLNTNNIRDITNDKTSGKFTIPVKIGLQKARLYHSCLILLSIIAWCFLVYFYFIHWVQLLFFPALFLVIRPWIGVLRTEPSPAYNNFLKQLSLGTFALVLVFLITSLIGRAIMLVELAKVLK